MDTETGKKFKRNSAHLKKITNTDIRESELREPQEETRNNLEETTSRGQRQRKAPAKLADYEID